MTDLPVVVFSGGRTTLPLARLAAVSGRARVAVVDPNVARSLSAEAGPVFCPLTGVTQQMRVEVMYEVVKVMASVEAAVPGAAAAFAADGLPPRVAETLPRWLPRATLAALSNLAPHVAALRAFAGSFPVAAYVTHEDVTPLNKALALTARSLGIPTFHLPHANHFGQVRPDVHDGSVCDWILAASRHMRDWYVERGFPPDRVEVVGHPPWDDLAAHPLPLRPLARRALRVPDDMPAVLFGSSWAQTTNAADAPDALPRAYAAFVEAAASEGWFVLWSMHPGEPPAWQQQHAARLNAAGVRGAVLRSHVRLALGAADVVVAAGPSNFLVEAAILGVPPVSVSVPNYRFPQAPPWTVRPTASAIARRVNAILADPEAACSRLPAAVSRYAAGADGGATRRALDFVLERAGLFPRREEAG